MDRFEDLKKHLGGLAEVFNSFRSEAVQLIVITRILGRLASDDGREDQLRPAQDKTKASNSKSATKILRELIENGYFDTPRSIGELAACCEERYDARFYTYQLSGLLLGLVKKQYLKRTTNPDTRRFVYGKV